MNNEAITAVAAHRAPPAPSALDPDSGFPSMKASSGAAPVDFSSACQCLVLPAESARHVLYL